MNSRIMLVYHIYICFFFTYCSCELSTSRITEIPGMANSRLKEYQGVLVKATSIVQCSVACAKDLTCESLTYSRVKGICIIYPFVINKNMDDLIAEDGWRSYKHCGDGCPSNCGYVYNKALDWCYRMVTEITLTPKEAATFCRLDGSRMIRINSQERQLHIMEFLYSMEQLGIWIGGHSVNRDNFFVYEDGTPLLYFNWDTHYPQFKSYIRMRINRNYSWEDVTGLKHRAFICER